MGWYYEEKLSGQSVSEFFEKKCTFYSAGYKSRMLDCAVVSMNTAYMAVEHTTLKTGQSKVYALVCHLQYAPNDLYNFGYKEVDEDMGPIEDTCPERIMKLLTPPTTDAARNWRERCWGNVQKRKWAPKMESGKYLVLDRPLSFSNGDEISTFYIKDARHRIFTVTKDGYRNYKLPANSKLRDIGYDVVEEPTTARANRPAENRAETGLKEESLLFSLK